MRFVCSKLSLFGQAQSDRESVVMTRHLAQIRSKFLRHNLDVLRCSIFDVLLENSGVMLPKFHPYLIQASHHKHILSVALWVGFGYILSYRCRTEK
jgi:hypothetical protein